MNEANPLKSITQVLENLETSKKELQDAILELKSRLEPILACEQPPDCAAVVDKPKEPCEITETLRSLNDSLQSVKDIILVIMGRIEL